MNDMTDPTEAAALKRAAEPSRTVRPLWEHVAEVGAPAAVSAAEALQRVATDEGGPTVGVPEPPGGSDPRHSWHSGRRP
ncbi:hypothetical protein [Kitasatospora sp. NPDC097643]|uniref:hypothetical protein n=1 Tax=Kitasatospora sp. NPDC097643 TaxID=3157230 RepID=UPI00332EE2A9